MTADAIREREPNIAGDAALLAKASAIVDYKQIALHLGEKLVSAGVEIALGQRLESLNETDHHVLAQTSDLTIEAKHVIACAGIEADRIAGLSGLADDFAMIPFRGEYFRLSSELDTIVQHLIYPVPDPAYPFLGVHLTRMIGGGVTVGPNAMLSLGRENYASNFPVLHDIAQAMAFPGFWKLMARNFSAGLKESQGAMFKRIYLERCRKYCPQLELKDLHPHPTGIRAQAVTQSGAMVDDFLIKQTKRCVHVCNAPSPAATSAFPIAEEIVGRVQTSAA